MIWLQLQWLAAVEVALLKGHHPLLNAVNSYDVVSIESQARVQPSLPRDVSIKRNNRARGRKDSKIDTSVEGEVSEQKPNILPDLFRTTAGSKDVLIIVLDTSSSG